VRLFREFANQKLAPDFSQVGVPGEFLQRPLFDRANGSFANAQQQSYFALGQSAVATVCTLAVTRGATHGPRGFILCARAAASNSFARARARA